MVFRADFGLGQGKNDPLFSWHYEAEPLAPQGTYLACAVDRGGGVSRGGQRVWLPSLGDAESGSSDRDRQRGSRHVPPLGCFPRPTCAPPECRPALYRLRLVRRRTEAFGKLGENGCPSRRAAEVSQAGRGGETGCGEVRI